MRTLLKKYLQEKEISQTDAAKKLGVTRAYLNSIVNGGPASRSLAERVELWSDGVVQRESLLWPNRDA